MDSINLFLLDISRCEHKLTPPSSSEEFTPRIAELTSSSRSILYSAHLLWDSRDHILIAAGTAFGEIIYWSWSRNEQETSYSRLHRVFLGHEGSIFGVRISSVLDIAGQTKRYLASCSDDRTIRVWDLSDIDTGNDTGSSQEDHSKTSRTRHTGFSSALFDAESSNSPCLAIGWGHVSRIWAVHFIESRTPDMVSLLSSGEDASSRTWQFAPGKEATSPERGTPISLIQTGGSAYHSGKNIWSTTLSGADLRSQQVVCGAADGKITAYPLPPSQTENEKTDLAPNEYTVEDILAMSGSDPSMTIPPRTAPAPKTAKQGNSFRGYAFIDEKSFLLITNAGKVLLQTLESEAEADGAQAISESKLIGQLDELTSYSVCTADSTIGVGFVAGVRGGIYIYRKGYTGLCKLDAIQGKIGAMVIGPQLNGTISRRVPLLVTLMGQKMAKLLYLDLGHECEPVVSKRLDIMISELATGSTVTSMTYIPTSTGEDYIVLGFRGGSIATYTLPMDSDTTVNAQVTTCIIQKVHGKEAVTSLLWHSSPSSSALGHLVSAGRDGSCVVNAIDFSTNTISLAHNLPLAVGPNLEGLYLHDNHLMMYGFSGTKFVVYNVTLEEETMSVETGGSHRSWSFRPNTGHGAGGTLVWTRAATMHIYTQKVANHTVIRSGGHGREIKDVAVTHPNPASNDSQTLIATGAEDTDIKIFEYVNYDSVCRRTLRKHVTGIQHLQWSPDSKFLFSSGGCEEFFIWRVRTLPGFMGIGVVCEAVCPPQSELPDVRIMSFDVRQATHGSGFEIAMVFSDSIIRVYHYNPAAEKGREWDMLAKGVYFTSCLTQCVFLSPKCIFTAGTDGHAVLWPLQETTHDSKEFSTQSLNWHSPARLHQNTSKTLSTRSLDNGSTLLVSGGDDGSLSFLLASPDGDIHMHSPIVVVRTHASAITACAIIVQQRNRIYILTSGNDQWVRVWEVILSSTAVSSAEEQATSSDPLTIKRKTKIRTHVADVSSMAILEPDTKGRRAKVIICGVGMEVLRLEW